jgi:single-stranded-DNA-specific exonuclease
MTTRQTLRRPLHGEPSNWPDTTPKALQRIYAARGLVDGNEYDNKLTSLLSPTTLGGLTQAVELLLTAIAEKRSIVIAGDYDCDGATGTAVAVRGLRLLGATQVDFVIPNRFKHGYGLSTGLVDAMPAGTEVIVTVDSGVASLEGVAHAKAKGYTVVITDHHLPGDTLPEADAIVNPNLNGDAFPSKSLAGVGVMFYLLLAMRAEQRRRGAYEKVLEPDLASLLDLVALGTVADLVVLDQNNRILVDAGIRRIRQGKACPGIMALVQISKKNPASLVSTDIGFSVAPRLNAAGRLENMSLGVLALITNSRADAIAYVQQLDEINAERKSKQADMVAQAETLVAEMGSTDAVGVVVFDPSWHAGIVGLVASKLKESLNRPTVAFAPGGEEAPDEVRGSCRSIEGFHLRDALALVDARHPGLILKFGGHAMAAGLSLFTKDIPTFTEAFDRVAREQITEDALQAVILSDGELGVGEITLQTAYAIRRGGPWGQGFPEPVFDNVFKIASWTVMGTSHLRLELTDPRDGSTVQGVYFFSYFGTPPPPLVRAVYSLSINEWQGEESLQLMIRHLEGPEDYAS